jgi:broad specificity phosphatase PhoE
MTIYLLRHGDKAKGSFFNPDLHHQDSPLSAKGQQDAVKIADYFVSKQIDAIYVSAYLRTHQTAQPLADRLHLQPSEDPRLNELDNGDIDDMTEQEFEIAYPEVWKAYLARTADFRFPGGETGQEACDRIADFLTEKRKTHAKENILVVSHDGLIRLAMCFVLDIPVYRRGDFKVDLCGITQLQFQEDVGRWKLFSFNQKV